MPKKKYTFIDLFAGCGGLSEGFLQTEKFEGLAHVEWESPMVNTFRQRLVDKWDHSEDDAKRRVIKFDVQKTDELIYGNWSDETKAVYEKENHPDIVAKELAAMCSLSERQVQRIMAKLKKQGVIRRIGPDKGGHWEIIAP